MDTLTRAAKSLREQLEEPYFGPETLPQLPCSLKSRLPCCRGRGYVVRPLGPYAHAELCVCVQNCKSCGGKAQLIVNNAVKACRNPDPRRIINIFNRAFIPARYSEAHLSVFHNMTGNCLRAIQALRQWLRHYDPKDRNQKGLILTGPVGVGKTYIVTAIAKGLAEKGVSVRFVDFFQLTSQIKGAYSESKSEKKLIDPLIAVDVLVIDELGKGRNTDFEATVLDQLIVGRYNENKILVASTNLSIKPHIPDKEDDNSFHYLGSLEHRVGPRIFSRLVETSTFVEIDGDDFRNQALQK